MRYAWTIRGSNPGECDFFPTPVQTDLASCTVDVGVLSRG